MVGNDINGWGSATVNQAMWLHTDAAVVRGNRWNNQARFAVQANTVAGLQALVVPDVAEEVLVTTADQPVTSILTSHQADTLGQIVFIKVVAGGSGLYAGTGCDFRLGERRRGECSGQWWPSCLDCRDECWIGLRSDWKQRADHHQWRRDGSQRCGICWPACDRGKAASAELQLPGTT